jgi:hypothetical protein
MRYPFHTGFGRLETEEEKKKADIQNERRLVLPNSIKQAFQIPQNPTLFKRSIPTSLHITDNDVLRTSRSKGL